MELKNPLYIVLTAILTSFLVACGGGGEQMFTTAQLQQQVSSATAQAIKAEAEKADAKLAAAKAELKKLAVDTARQGGFSSMANCNVLPVSFATTSAAKNFPTNAPGEYRAICSQEVMAMNAERANTKQKAVVAERTRVAKLAADKQKAEAKRLAALKQQKPKTHFERKG